jgi:hypothetical protein
MTDSTAKIIDLENMIFEAQVPADNARLLLVAVDHELDSFEEELNRYRSTPKVASASEVCSFLNANFDVWRALISVAQVKISESKSVLDEAAK